MDIVAKQYNIEAIHINNIMPGEQQLFEGPDLSEIGKRRLWMVISEKMKLTDESDAEALSKRRTNRITGQINAEGNINPGYNNQRRRNRDNYLGIRVRGAQEGVNMAPDGELQSRQRRHRMLMNGPDQLERQDMIQQYIERRNRNLGRNGAAEWNRIMRFINNMRINQGEPQPHFQERINDAYSR